MAAISSFQYPSVERVRDAMIMRKSTSDIVSGLKVLSALNLAGVKSRAPRHAVRGGELTELFDPDVSMKDRLMEYKENALLWHEGFDIGHNQHLSVYRVVEASLGVRLDLAVLATAVKVSRESLGLTKYYTRSSDGERVPEAPGMSLDEAKSAQATLSTACDQLAQTICRVLRESEPGFLVELQRNETIRALLTAIACAVLLGREHINLCISALLGVRQQFPPDELLLLQLGAVEACSFRHQVASVGPVLQDVLATNKNDDVASVIVRGVLLGSQRTELRSSNGMIISFDHVFPVWDFPIVFELLAQSWYEATRDEDFTSEGKGKWGTFCRLMGACLSVLHAIGMEAYPSQQYEIGLTTAEKLAVVRKGGRFVSNYDRRFSVREVDQPKRDRCWRNEERRSNVSKAFVEWYCSSAGSEPGDTKLSELLSEAELTYQDYLKAALIEGDRGGVLSKENTCFGLGTPEGPINLIDGLKLETVAEEMFFTDVGLGSIASPAVKIFSVGKDELNVTSDEFDDYVTIMETGPPAGVSGETKIGGRDNRLFV